MRSTRKFMLTEEGTTFHERALRVLADLDEAERAVAACHIRGAGFGSIPMSPSAGISCCRWCRASSEEHPGVQLDITLSDAVIDLMDERADVAIRVGPLRSSQLVARKLGESRMAVVAAPDYLGVARRPPTRTRSPPSDLITFNFARHSDSWPFTVGGRRSEYPAHGRATVETGKARVSWRLAGQGLTRLSLFHIAHDIADGRLVPVLEAFNPGDVEEIHVVYVGHGGRLPARVRAFIDFLVAEVDLRPFAKPPQIAAREKASSGAGRVLEQSEPPEASRARAIVSILRRAALKGWRGGSRSRAPP